MRSAFSRLDKTDYTQPLKTGPSLKRLRRSPSTKFSVQNVPTFSSRTKRDLHFVGDFLSYCCGVLSKNEFTGLLASDSRIKTYLTNLQENICDNHKSLDAVTDFVNNYEVNISYALHELRDKFANLANQSHED